jgi:hypothetical protein
VVIKHDSEAFYALTMGVAEGRIDKAAVAVELERIARAKPDDVAAAHRATSRPR